MPHLLVSNLRYIRRRGFEPADAQDLTQSFFAHILQRGLFQRARRDKGKFRSFVLGSLKFFLADELARLQAQKRGGGCTLVSLDAVSAEARYQLEPADPWDAEKLFERRWALTLIECALGRLEAEFRRAGRQRVFDSLRALLLGEPGTQRYAAIGAELGLSESAVKVTVHRMRQRFREIFREELAHTLAEPDQLDEEMRYVFAVVRG